MTKTRPARAVGKKHIGRFCLNRSGRESSFGVKFEIFSKSTINIQRTGSGRREMCLSAKTVIIPTLLYVLNCGLVTLPCGLKVIL